MVSAEFVEIENPILFTILQKIDVCSNLQKHALTGSATQIQHTLQAPVIPYMEFAGPVNVEGMGLFITFNIHKKSFVNIFKIPSILEFILQNPTFFPCGILRVITFS